MYKRYCNLNRDISGIHSMRIGSLEVSRHIIELTSQSPSHVIFCVSRYTSYYIFPTCTVNWTALVSRVSNICAGNPWFGVGLWCLLCQRTGDARASHWAMCLICMADWTVVHRKSTVCVGSLSNNVIFHHKNDVTATRPWCLLWVSEKTARYRDSMCVFKALSLYDKNHANAIIRDVCQRCMAEGTVMYRDFIAANRVNLILFHQPWQYNKLEILLKHQLFGKLWYIENSQHMLGIR